MTAQHAGEAGMQQRMSAVTVPVITVIAVAVSIVTAFVGSGAVGATPVS